MSDVTVTITSCGRYDLLKRTLDSFLKTNTYPVSEILVSEDSEDQSMKNKILAEYHDKITLIFNEKNLGLLGSLDNLFSKVKTKYIFHIEDDWEFDDNNHKYIQESKDILENNSNINQVWIRSDAPKEWFDKNILSINNTKFSLVNEHHLDLWSGFSFNPGLRRTKDYETLFPNGFKHHHIKELPIVHSEYACNHHVNKFGYRAAILLNTCCRHIGDNRTTENKYLIFTGEEKNIDGVIYRVAFIRK